MIGRLAVALVGYALGSIPIGYLVVRWRTGRDVRRLGSGSTGGRNVGRQLGSRWGWASGIGDGVKGGAAALFAKRIGPGVWPFAMLGAVVGHIWPVTLCFSGGRGVAPATGAMVVGDPAVAVAGLAAVLVSHVGGASSQAAIVAGLLAAPAATVALRRPASERSGVLATLAVILVAHGPHLRTALTLDAGKRRPRAIGLQPGGRRAEVRRVAGAPA